MYDMKDITEYYRCLNWEDKEKLLYWITKELSNARARIWLSMVIYGNSHLHETRFNGDK